MGLGFAVLVAGMRFQAEEPAEEGAMQAGGTSSVKGTGRGCPGAALPGPGALGELQPEAGWQRRRAAQTTHKAQADGKGTLMTMKGTIPAEFPSPPL